MGDTAKKKRTRSKTFQVTPNPKDDLPFKQQLFLNQPAAVPPAEYKLKLGSEYVTQS
jgi:hypothetical protein